MAEEEQKFSIGNVEPREIVDEMKESYLDYAMSVIVMRALPDVRDGSKPVHRRILYAMSELGLRHNVKFLKCARIVGDVLGKYHPHGDMAVYDALARMAQDFSLRYPLVDGQGNFGSVDGDSPAAMRYTEARMTAVAEEMLFDIEKETVDFVDNYDGTRKEPKVLPARVPQLLLNGQTGIAVGMATNIPPHNLGELVDATIHLIDHPKADVTALLEFVKGPDFPTGGIVYNQDDIVTVYSTGRGPLTVRGKAEIAETKSGHHQIIISEIPFQVNKSSLIEKMADLVREKTIEGIRDIRDESDKDGLRIAIDLKNDAFPQKILNKLYKLTDLQKAFHCNILALVDGIQPTVLSLKAVLEYFIAHRREVVERRTRYDLGKAKDRAHILEGLKKALDHIDRIIATIKKSASKEDAHVSLVRVFALTEIQATAILEMKLQTLAGLERKKIEDELEEKKKLIAYLSGLLKDPKKILGVVKKELEEIKEKYADVRRTKIIKGKVSEFKEEDLIPDEETMIALSYGGYIKRVNPAMYRTQRRGGKGIIGMETKEEDVVEHLLSTNAHANILFFTNKGKVFQTKAYEVPEASRVSKGKAIANILDIQQQDAVTALVPLKEMLGKKGKSDAASDIHLIMATKNGIIKKVKASEFITVRSTGVQAITLKGSDMLKWVRISHGGDEIILLTKNGKAIRFHEKNVRAMGRTAGGVRAITLKGGDEVVGVDVIPAGRASEFELLVISENGLGKKTALDEYRAQGRGGQGIKTYNVSEKTGKLVASLLISQEEEDLIAISKKGQVIRTQLVSIPALARATQGVRVMRLATGDRVASIVCL
ncbi:MAG: DNA gyrase subunit A [Patescibacteria group bacterium]